MIKYAEVAPEYARLWTAMEIRPERLAAVELVAKRIARNREKYEAVGLIPWELTGTIHEMECSGSFNQHLHNGDPLKRQGVPAKTVNVPAGRGPFPNWSASAADAIGMKIKPLAAETLAAIKACYIPSWLWFLERYNGTGYRGKGINTPYLWSFTNHYERGKYVADGKYDPSYVSGQAGAAAILKVLREIERDPAISV